tara:strand:- start:3575 stop:5032 length:1458 start_codon:yes stop_codon:yes gene_type:complete
VLQKPHHDFLEKEFSNEWGERATLWCHDFFSYPFTIKSEFPWNTISNNLSYFIHPDLCGSYIEKKEFLERGKNLAKFFVNGDNIPLLLEKYDELITHRKVFTEKIEKINFSKMSKSELLPYFKEFVDICNTTCIWYRATRNEAENEVVNIVKEKLKKHNVEEHFQLLITSPYTDPIKEEKKDWLTLIQQKSLEKKDYQNHIKNHSMFFTNMFSEKEIVDSLNKKYTLDKKSMGLLKSELDETQNKLNRIKNKQEMVLNKINDSDLEKYLVLFHRFGEYRLKLKPGYAGIEVLSLPMLNRLGELAGMSVKDMHEYLTINETLTFLKKGILPENDILERRKVSRVLIVRNKEFVVLDGEDGKQFVENVIFKKNQGKDEFKGRIAYPGKVMGKVRLIKTNQLDEIQKAFTIFQEGEILVTSETQPNMVPLMKKAAAIVTQQGGITSHSGIVAREFKIPCIVGIDSILLNLETGDLIEVDADNGIIRKL